MPEKQDSAKTAGSCFFVVRIFYRYFSASNRRSKMSGDEYILLSSLAFVNIGVCLMLLEKLAQITAFLTYISTLLGLTIYVMSVYNKYV